MKKIFKIFICILSFSMFFACDNQSNSSSEVMSSSSISNEVSSVMSSSDLLSSEENSSNKNSEDESEEIQTSTNETLSGHLNHSSNGEGPIIDWEN